jgi:ketosteroid isomerase-like protein
MSSRTASLGDITNTGATIAQKANATTTEAAVLKRVTEGYKAFVEVDVEHLKNYFTDDCEMNPQFPVDGWKPVKGFGAMMEQFGAMMTDANPGVQDFRPVPYQIDVSADGTKAYVYEDVTTKLTRFKGMAIHHYNEQGRCFLVTPYHDSKKMTVSGALQNNIENGICDSANAKAVLAMIQGWGAGELQTTSGCSKYFTEDSVFDAKHDMKNTRGYKMYSGLQGCVDWCDFLTTIDMPDFQPLNIVEVGTDTVVMRMRFTATVKATKKSAPTTDNCVWLSMTDGKISAMKFYFDKMDELDACFV